MLYKFSNLVHCSLTTVLILTAVIGDLLVAHSTVQLHKAFFDNLTHAAIAGISWLIVCFQLKYDSILKAASEAFVCSLLGSFIDLDHFLMAHSMHLKAATDIKTRPPLHCSTIPLIFCAFTLLLSHILQMESLQKMGLLVFTAFFSHHTRDAARRGFWFYPFSSTPPITKFAYIGLTCLIPYAVCAFKEYSNKKHLNNMFTDFIV